MGIGDGTGKDPLDKWTCGIEERITQNEKQIRELTRKFVKMESNLIRSNSKAFTWNADSSRIVSDLQMTALYGKSEVRAITKEDADTLLNMLGIEERYN